MFVRQFGLSLLIGMTASVTSAAFAQAPASSDATPEEIVITAKRLDTARDAIAPSLGASDYVIDRKAIENTPQGVDTSFNQVLLQAPGVSQDSYGQLHVRNEHGNLQYRITGSYYPKAFPASARRLPSPRRC